MIELISNGQGYGKDKEEKVYIGGIGNVWRHKAWCDPNPPSLRQIQNGIRDLIMDMDDDGKLDQWLTNMK